MWQNAFQVHNRIIKTQLPVKTSKNGGNQHAKTLSSHLLCQVVPVHVTLARVHLFLVEEPAPIRHQQGLAHVLAVCSGNEEKARG